MKQTAYQLSNAGIEEEFFGHCRLIAIQSSFPGYTLCAHFNTRLGLTFERIPELDIHIDFTDRKPKNTSLGLFEALTEQLTFPVCFPVYQYAYPAYEDARMLLYTNKSEGMNLLPDMKWADFILMLQGETYDDISKAIPDIFSRMEKISWYRELDIASLKWKKNLII